MFAKRLVAAVCRSAVATRLNQISGAVLFAVALVLLLAQTGGHAQSQVSDPLSYSTGFLITGNYVVGGVDLTKDVNPSVGGFSTGVINISGVPANADILAAYLYWETIHLATVDATAAAAGVQFNGSDVESDSVTVVQSAPVTLQPGSNCYSSGNQSVTMRKFKADVMRLLPLQMDLNGPTGKRLANGAHTVRLPDVSGGNQAPESGGATLLIVYRDPEPSPTLNPLRKIVVYDGNYVLPDLVTSMTQNLRGIYKSAATKSAKITYIAGSGQPNANERILLNGSPTPVATNSFAGANSAERAWNNPTYDVSSNMNPGGNTGDGFGETVTATLDHSGGGGYDCLAVGAIVFSTAIADE